MIKYLILISMLFSFNIKAEKISFYVNDIKVEYLVEKTKENYTMFPLNEKQDTEVLYFFNYNCPSCLLLHSSINGWESIVKKENIRFEKISVNLHDGWSYSTKLFLLLKIMKITDYEEHLYQYIHQEHHPIINEEYIYKFLEDKLKIRRSLAKLNIDSPRMNYMLYKSESIKRTLNINSTPMVIINKGQYRYTIRIVDGMEPMSIILGIQDIILNKQINNIKN